MKGEDIMITTIHIRYTRGQLFYCEALKGYGFQLNINSIKSLLFFLSLSVYVLILVSSSREAATRDLIGAHSQGVEPRLTCRCSHEARYRDDALSRRQMCG